jgi:hypothetical protein
MTMGNVAMTDPSEALPFSEAAREAAATIERFEVRGPYGVSECAARGEADRLAADRGRLYPHLGPFTVEPVRYIRVDDPRAKAFLKLAALSDEELVERVAMALLRGVPYPGSDRPDDATMDDARAVLAALGLPVAEQED